MLRPGRVPLVNLQRCACKERCKLAGIGAGIGDNDRMPTHTLEQLRTGQLAGARRLDLSAGLTRFPREIFELADSLEVLNLSGNRLSELPDDLGRLRRLRIIFCSDNDFTHLPECLGDCPALEMVGFKANRIDVVPAQALPARLRWLILTDNRLTQLPVALGERAALQKLMLAGNRLQALPDSLADARRLELLRLSANALPRLPAWLTELPRLSWLALSGNPLGWPCPETPALPVVPWHHLVVEDRLGGGASGDIYRVREAGTGQRSWALKLFKGAVTSDGRPEDEWRASLIAGHHPALVTPAAQMQGHPDGMQGVLMPLLPAGHVALASPPSFESCTRDVYAPGQLFDGQAVRGWLGAMAAALTHLHARSVMHGDFYAHNIHVSPDSGEAVLGDFGAATVLPTGQAPVADALRALEVRAFGCLMDELLQRLAPSDAAWATRLQPWVEACLDAVPSRRPSMRELATVLG